MPVIFVGVCFFGAVAAMIFVKSLDVAAGVKVAMIIPLVFLVIYSLARIPPGKSEGREESRR